MLLSKWEHSNKVHGLTEQTHFKAESTEDAATIAYLSFTGSQDAP